MRPKNVHSTILTGPRSLQIVAHPRPPLEPGQVRIAVEQCGICDSDVRRWRGRGRLPFPVQLGHEFAGEIVERGPEVERARVGQRVAVWAPSYVPVSAEHPGVRGLAQEVVADARHCFAVGDGVRFPFAAEPLGRVVTTIRAADAVLGSHTVIIGSSFKALLAVAWISRYCIPGSLMLVTSNSDAREPADQLGATHVIAPKYAHDVVRRVTKGRRADVVYELTGTQTGLELATHAVCNGGQLVVGSAEVDSYRDMSDFLSGQDVRYLEGDQREERLRLAGMALGVGLLNESALDLDQLPIVQYPGERARDAFEEAARGIHKVVVTP